MFISFAKELTWRMAGRWKQSTIIEREANALYSNIEVATQNYVQVDVKIPEKTVYKHRKLKYTCQCKKIMVKK